MSEAQLGQKSRFKYYFYIVALGAYLCGYLSDPEIFQRIVVGNWIFFHKTLPTTYLWSLASKDIAWLDSSWLFNLGLSLIETNFHWQGISLTKAALSILFVFFLADFLVLILKDFFVSGLISTIVAVGVLENITLSPELFVICFLPLLFNFVRKYLAGDKKGGWLFAFFLLSLVLANIHFAFIFIGLGIIILLLPKANSKKDVFYLLLAVFLSVALSPYGFKIWPWIYQLTSKNLSYYFVTQELVANIFEYPFVCLILLWVMVLIFLYSLQNIKDYFCEVIFLTALTILSCAFKTIIPFSLVALSYLLANLWKDAADKETLIPLQIFFSSFGKKLAKLSDLGAVFLLFSVAFVNIENLRRIASVTILFPEAEMDYILEKKLPLPLWHQSVIAPYLIYRFANEKGEPRELVRIDKTAILNNPQLIREEFHKMWRKGFAENPPKTALVHYYSPLYDALIQDPKWKLVWQNDKEVSSQGQETEEEVPFYAWAIFVNSVSAPF